MPRGQFFGHREALPDTKYRDKLIGKFLNILMEDGKRSTAERICYGAFDRIHEKTGGTDPMKVFRAAIDNVKPRRVEQYGGIRQEARRRASYGGSEQSVRSLSLVTSCRAAVGPCCDRLASAPESQQLVYGFSCSTIVFLREFSG